MVQSMQIQKKQQKIMLVERQTQKSHMEMQEIQMQQKKN